MLPVQGSVANDNIGTCKAAALLSAWQKPRAVGLQAWQKQATHQFRKKKPF
jgi:hypothetical protein